MGETPSVILSLIAGVSLGAIFFGGLWLTIRNGVASQRPALWFAVSFLLRTSIVVGGIYFVSYGDWRRLLACLCGLLAARSAVMRLSRAPVEKADALVAGGGL
jgi:F1F0 ATPase subunit 2